MNTPVGAFDRFRRVLNPGSSGVQMLVGVVAMYDYQSAQARLITGS
jgi:hypothetical protein